MRRITAIMLCASVAAVALSPAGCDQWQHRPRDPLILKATQPGIGPDQPRTYLVRIVRLRHRLRPDAPLEDTWRLLGTTTVPHEKRALWQANDLRLGEGGAMAAQYLTDLLAETADRTVRTSRLTVQENMDFVVEIGGPRTGIDIVWTDRSGRLGGRHFDAATARFRCVCRRHPDDPETACLALVPEIAYGRQRMQYERTEHGVMQRMRQDRFAVPDLEAEVALAPGRLLLVGATPSSEVSVGGAFFLQRRGPDTWKETLLVTARPLAPGAAPEPDKDDDLDAAAPPPPDPRRPREGG